MQGCLLVELFEWFNHFLASIYPNHLYCAVAFDVGIEEYEPGMGSGPVLIDYFNQLGYMCAEDFDDADANVLCRQKGYKGGYSYK